MVDLQTAFKIPGLTLATVKVIVKQSLLALNCLHAICGIIHCGKSVLIILLVALKKVFDADIKP